MRAIPLPVPEVAPRGVAIPTNRETLSGDLQMPPDASGLVIFAHASGSSRHSARNRLLARRLNHSGIGTLLLDLLTEKEELKDLERGHLRFDVELLAARLVESTAWASSRGAPAFDHIAYFGASTGAAAALIAAASLGSAVEAVVARGGRPDMAGERLGHVKAPTLLIVGGRDDIVLRFNRRAFLELGCEKALQVVPGATHLFEEPGALDKVANLASDWFEMHVGRR